ncbi:MAG: hypothetical protein JWN98_2639 [Abditibacteriota bacterium]|nr:hypothetical protein [Abditibacteriota bacterium]
MCQTLFHNAIKAARNAFACNHRLNFVAAVRVAQSAVDDAEMVQLMDAAIEEFPRSEALRILQEVVDAEPLLLP